MHCFYVILLKHISSWLFKLLDQAFLSFCFFSQLLRVTLADSSHGIWDVWCLHVDRHRTFFWIQAQVGWEVCSLVEACADGHGILLKLTWLYRHLAGVCEMVRFIELFESWLIVELSKQRSFCELLIVVPWCQWSWLLGPSYYDSLPLTWLGNKSFTMTFELCWCYDISLRWNHWGTKVFAVLEQVLMRSAVWCIRSVDTGEKCSDICVIEVIIGMPNFYPVNFLHSFEFILQSRFILFPVS